MKKILPLCALFVFTAKCYSQTNLVNNGSFESYSNCPTAFSQVNYANGWVKSFIWNSNPGGWHTEYMNSCNGGNWVGVPANGWGSQTAYDGSGYIAQAPSCPSQQANYRENIYTSLSSPLQIGATYTISYRISLADNCRYASDKYCVQLGTDAVFPINNQALHTAGLITNKTNWTLISHSFVADSNYTYLSLGNFYDDANTSYVLTYPAASLNNALYYVDSLQLYMTSGPSAPDIQSTFACLTGSFSLNNAASLISVAWNFGDLASGPNNTSTLTNPTHIFTSAGSYTVSAIAQFPSGPDTITQVVSVSGATTTASFTAANVPCGTAVTFNNTSGNYTSCSWDFGDSNTSTLIAPSHLYANSGIYTVTMIAYGPCNNDTIVQNVTVTVPVIDASYTATGNGCSGSPVYFAGNAPNATTYWWDFGDGNNASTIAPTHIYASAGSYTVTFVGTNFCTNDTVIHVINVTQSPGLSINVSSDTICTGSSVVLNATGGTSIQWSGGSTSTAYTVTDFPTSNTSYVATVTDGVCSTIDSVYIVVDPCLGMTNGIGEGAGLTLFPNPAKTTVSVISVEAIQSIEVYDVLGNIVYSESMAAPTKAAAIDVSKLRAGSYQLIAKTSNGVITSDFIVE